MSKLIVSYLPFYKMLKKDKAFGWNEDCVMTFVQLKEYLFSPLILTRQEDGETFFLYIAMLDKTVGIVLIGERHGD